MVYRKELVKRGFDLGSLTQQQKQLIDKIERANRTKALVMLDDDASETEIDELDAKITALKDELESTLKSSSIEGDTNHDDSNTKSSGGIIVAAVLLIFTGLAIAAGSRIKE